MDLALYREVVERIRQSGSELLVNLTTGPGGRFVPGEDNTMWFGASVAINTPRSAAMMAQAIRAAHVLPELEV
jgi:uncharacterized protein (DUF849 family)